MSLEAIFTLVEICHQQNLQQVILSPGSRVAPLTLAFVRHPSINTISISDERVAAFTAMGMANQYVSDFIQQDQENLTLVGIACTSGSAVYNYAPAIAEAFYQQIPLLVFTADRPPEWIDQLDGQTIRQREIYGNHVKESFELPVDTSHKDAMWQTGRIVNEAINMAKTLPYGPVHINIPIREPFYPAEKKAIQINHPKIVECIPFQSILSKNVWNTLLDQWDSAEKKMIVAGQQALCPPLAEHLRLLQQEFGVVIIGDSIANLHGLKEGIRQHDLILEQQEESTLTSLQPDLLITFGKSVLSKVLKKYLRTHAPHQHWHIQSAGKVADTFQSLTHIIPVKPEYFFGQLFSDLDFMHFLEGDVEESEKNYVSQWQKEENKAKRYITSFLNKDAFSELHIVGWLLEKLPKICQVHLANSMSVRYVNLWGMPPSFQGEVFANRGTSGIDGSTSTAVGAALANPDTPVVLLTGDLAFFYDRNALWNNYLPNNLRIVLLNNHGGNIFSLIKGPSQQPELEEYFETEQKLIAEKTILDAGLEYFSACNWEELESTQESFWEKTQTSKCLEIKTDKLINTNVFTSFKEQFLKTGKT